MEIEAKLENIDKKIEGYNEKIDNISSLITTLIHTFQQNQLPNIKSDILNSIEEKFKDASAFPDVDEMKTLFNKIREEINENQSGLKIKIIELENVISKVNDAIDNLSQKTDVDANDEIKSQLLTIEANLKELSSELSNLKTAQVQIPSIEKVEQPNTENIDKIVALISSQNTAIEALQNDIEKNLQNLESKIQNSFATTADVPSSQASIDTEQISEKINDLNLAITSVLSAIKIIDKKYVELKNFQELVEKLTNDVVSPILQTNDEIREFLAQTTDNFAVINEFVREYDKGAIALLEGKLDEIASNIQDVNSNIDKITDTVNIDVNRLFDLVDEFKTNSDLSNHTISDNMEKIENMLTEYNDNLEELTKTATAEVVKDGVKTLNDEFYLELLNLFNNLSFDEEAEDLKDFIENILASITVKTDENSEKLNSIMLQFKSLLNKIEGIEKTQNSISDYLKPEDNDDLVYSFDDIQTDLAKMRLVLNDISKSVSSSELVDEISEKITKTVEQIETVSKQLGSSADTEENVIDIRAKIEELNTQVYDISLRTNKLLLSNEDSTLELKNNLEIFKEVFDKANPEKLYDLFYELTHYFNDVNEKVNEVILTSKASHTEAVTIKNALVYVGEWLDNATTVLEELRANSAAALNPKTADSSLEQEINELKKSVNNDMTNIFARIKMYEDDTQKRLDKLEEKIDMLLSAKATTKEASNKPMNTKLDNMNKKFSKMEAALVQLSEKIMKE